MKILLVIFLFTTDPYGNPEQFEVITEPFETIEACNVAGRNLRELVEIPEEVKTLSYCVREEEFYK